MLDDQKPTQDIDELMIELMSVQRGVSTEGTRKLVQDALAYDQKWARDYWSGWYRLAAHVMERISGN